jgi:hypothetical protein
VEILSRYKGKSPHLVPYEKTLVPAVNAFAKLYDATRTAQLEASNTEQSEAIEAVRLIIRVWSAAVCRDIPGFEIASFTDRLAAPDDVINGGQRLLELCRNYKDGKGNPLAYQAELDRVLSEAMVVAEKEWAAARARMTTTQEMRKATREAAVAAHKELVAFRRALRSEFGDSNVDYRALRVQNTLDHDDSDEVVEETDPVEPAAVTRGANAVSNGTSPVTNGVHTA